MVGRLVKCGLMKPGRRARAVEELEKYWRDGVADVWLVSDVESYAVEEGYERPTRESCRAVLRTWWENSDAQTGMNWNQVGGFIRKSPGLEEYPEGCADVWDERDGR